MPQPPAISSPQPPDPRAERFAALPLVRGIEQRPSRTRPLPDAGAIRLVPVPDAAPPYDEDRPGSRATPAPSRGSPGAAASTAGPQVAPGEPESTADGPESTANGPESTAGQSETDPGDRQPRRAAGPPGPVAPAPRASGPPRPATARPQDPAAAWPSRFAQVLAETLAGSRSGGQIAPWTSVQARRRIRQLGPMLTAGAAPRVRRIVATRPAADVVEMTVVVGFGERVRALAVRLERNGPEQHPGPGASERRWVCTAIEAA
jgi:hypothetical protein